MAKRGVIIGVGVFALAGLACLGTTGIVAAGGLFFAVGGRADEASLIVSRLDEPMPIELPPVEVAIEPEVVEADSDTEAMDEAEPDLAAEGTVTGATAGAATARTAPSGSSPRSGSSGTSMSRTGSASSSSSGTASGMSRPAPAGDPEEDLGDLDLERTAIEIIDEETETARERRRRRRE